MRTIQGMAPAGAHSSHKATGQAGIAQNKWQLLKVIEDIREPLGLKGTSISLLRAMISFLRVDNVDATRDDPLSDAGVVPDLPEQPEAEPIPEGPVLPEQGEGAPVE